MYLSLELLIGGVLMICTTATATTCTSEGYVLKEEVRYVPKNRMEYEEVAKSLQCVPSLKLTFLIETWKNGTIVGCFCDVKIFGKYCAELNKGSKYRVQANYGAPCDKFTITPCPDSYFSSESYLVWQCFVEHGNILSPWELALENENFQRTVNALERDLQIQTKLSTDEKEKNLMLENKTRELALENENFQRTVNDLERDLQIQTKLSTDEKEKNLMLENKTREQNLTIMKLESELKKHEMKEQCTGTSTGAVIGYCVLSVVAYVIFFIIKKRSIIFHIRKLLTNNQTQQPHALGSVTSIQNTQGNNSGERNDGNNEDIPSVFSSSCTDTTTRSTAIEDSSQKKNVDNENESMDKAEEEPNDDHDDNDANQFSPEDADLLCENVKQRELNDDYTDDDELEENQYEDENAAFQISTTVSRSEDSGIK